MSTVSSACTFKTIQGTGLVALTKNQEGFIAVKNVYNPVIQTISLGRKFFIFYFNPFYSYFIGADARLTVSAWCVVDPADITVAYACDNIISTCSTTSSRRDQV